MNLSEIVKRIAKLELYGEDQRAKAYNEALMAAIHIVEKFESKQPQLNDNQQIVLDWLKQEWLGRKRHTWVSLECIATLVYHWQNGDPDYYPSHAAPHVEAYGELAAVEHLEILQVFSQWALEQEEE